MERMPTMKKTKHILTITFLTVILTTLGLVSANAVDETTPTQAPTQSAKVTTLTLKKTSAALYVKGTYTISVTVKNGAGKTTFKSSNKKIAAVNNNGKIKAVKKGTAKITVTNNKVSKTFTVKVKNPKLNAKSKTLKVGKTFKVKITGKIGKAKFKSSNKKVATVNSSGKIKALKKGTATITTTANGVKLKTKVTVKAKAKTSSKWKLVKYKVTLKRRAKTINANIGEGNQKVPYEIEIDDNLFTLYNKKKITLKQLNSFNTKLNNIIYKNKVKFSISNSSIGKLTKTSLEVNKEPKVKPLKKGTATIKIKYKNQSVSIKYTVTKHDVFTFRGKKSKAVYNLNDLCKYILKEYDNNFIKGNLATYYNYVLYFNINPKNKDYAKFSQDIYDKVYDTVKHKHDWYIYECYTLESVDEIDKKGIITYYFTMSDGNNWKKDDETNLKYLKEEKNLYNKVTKILKDINIDSYKNDYEKLFVIGEWMNKNWKYGDCDPHGHYYYISDESYMFNQGEGGCFHWADATTRFCRILKIPCYEICSSDHSWNIVKIQGKWYHLDILWDIYFEGNTSILTYRSHDFRYDEALHQPIYTDKELKKKFNINKIEDNCFMPPTDMLPLLESFGWSKANDWYCMIAAQDEQVLLNWGKK